jgi:methylmalonyl-CoA/ethylmalonyl-CoA epimerase
VKISRVNHLGVVVDDLERSIAAFSELLGLPLDRIEEYGSELDIAFLPCGDTQVELISPHRREGFTGAYLAEHGPGIQHVAFEVEDLEEALAELAERGVKPLGEALRPGAGNTIIAFLDPAAFGDILVELCQQVR